MDTQICSRCRVTQPLSAYDFRAASENGLQDICKTCRKDLNSVNNPHHNARNRRARLLAGVSNGEWRQLTTEERTHWRELADQLTDAGSTFEGAVQAQKTRKDGVVYIISHPRLPGIKIGRAFDAESRLKNYQTGCPHRAYRLDYVSPYVDDCYTLEAGVHAMLKPWAMEGEWFNIPTKFAQSLIDYSTTLQRSITA